MLGLKEGYVIDSLVGKMDGKSVGNPVGSMDGDVNDVQLRKDKARRNPPHTDQTFSLIISVLSQEYP